MSAGRWLEDHALALGQSVVPAAQRAEWQRAWEAELWYGRRQGRNDLWVGMLRDALWLRGDEWRQALGGTALLCLLMLLALVASAGVPLFVLVTTGLLPRDAPLQLLPRFLIAAGLTLFVSYATRFAAVVEGYPGDGRDRMRAAAFQCCKVGLLLLVAALVSTDLCFPLECQRSFVAMPLELLCFVILTLLGLRWSFTDSQGRCKHCLRSLAAPQRVGRPSWNFLDYNGIELACPDGHGLLAVPELETSWCRSSSWISQSLP